ncbi:uncharacterized protein EI90DRAFT_3059259 [Cantharellus anzutake]|uniref:uncharacterized protein n=1 Tax=Cantharellus anzutake TaxID=1750568 RepID=UPI001903A4A4|nr:uncharacterized protein EI90DRAFT_3059259 [Cantharellus anzutake]KAF8330784.1 hypothetical protein EI90DRAFT_3059259 [Cantharellus anzutake]
MGFLCPLHKPVCSFFLFFITSLCTVGCLPVHHPPLPGHSQYKKLRRLSGPSPRHRFSFFTFALPCVQRCSLDECHPGTCRNGRFAPGNVTGVSETSGTQATRQEQS